MKPTTNGLFASQSSPSFTAPRFRGHLPITFTSSNHHHHHHKNKKNLANVITLSLPSDDSSSSSRVTSSRRAILVAPPLLAAVISLWPSVSSAAGEISSIVAADASPEPAAPPPPATPSPVEEITSRIYDATALGEPMAVGKDKKRVWEKLLNARIVYLGEAEQVPTRDDKDLELEIVRNLRKRCVESERQLSLALEAFPVDLQDQLNQYMDTRMDGEALKSYVSHWPAQRWQEYEPLLTFCRDNSVKLIACGTPLKVLRTVQAEGIRGLSESERRLYTPPAGSGFISGFTPFSRNSSLNINPLTQIVPFGPSSYLSAQARVVEDHTMSQVILQAVADGGGTGLLLVVTGANHVEYGSRGTGLPARVSRKIPKKSQLVVLLDPERQFLRKEGESPVADFLWYSAARPCSRNCFDRAEIARVMNAAGRSRDALPQDIQKGLDLGLVSPEILQNFFDLEQYPLIAELTQRFQGFRERLLADPKFLNRLAIEEAISITTTLVAQYEKRKENFFEELDYVITDSVRASVVDFFTVWLPAPTLSFLSYADETARPNSIDALRGLLGSIPDNAFQKSLGGKDWTLNLRIASVIVGGLKLAGVGVVSSFAAVGSSNALYAIRKFIKPELAVSEQTKRSPMLKTAVVYGGYLGTSSNIRYQIIAGLIEHRISDELSSQPLLVNMISFVVRVANSYYGTQLCMEQKKISYLEATVCARPSCRSILSLVRISSTFSPLVISSFQSQLRPPARLRTPSPPSVSTPPSVSFVSTPPSDSESRLHPPTPLIRLRNPSLPSRLRPASHLSRPCPASPPSKLQVHPPPDPPPCTYPPVLPEARSPPKPPDPPDVPFNLVLLLMSDTASSQLVSKTPDLKSLMLNLVPVFSDGVISLVCVDDTSFVSKCLSPAVCSVFLYWCVDWSLHRFSPRDFIYPPLPFIMLVIVVVDSTMGCSIPIPNSISVSLPLPLIQVLSQRFLNLILGDELISLVWYLELSVDLSLFFALVRPFTAVCSPFTAVCSSISVVFKSLCAQWQLNGLMPHISIHHVNRVVYCPVSAFMEFVLLPISSSTLCGFGVGNVLLKIIDTSNTEVLIKGFVAMLKIVDCALVAASMLGFISLPVVTNFQGFILLYSSMVAEIRGLLDIISCLSALYAPIFLCCICFLVIGVCCLPWMALSSCMHTFSIYGE